MTGPAYPPLDTPKPVARDIWVVDGPVIRFYKMPFPTRATALRLANGDLWLHSPTRWSASLQAQLEELGPIRHLVAPNWIHYASLPEWQAALPGAQVWAAPGVAARAASRNVAFRIDHALGQDAPPDWAGQVDQMVVTGSNLHAEAVFFHRASSSLILTDLIENFELRTLPWWMRGLVRLGGIAEPGAMPRDMRASFAGHRAELRAQVQRMIAWAPERVIVAHGRWYDRDGTAQLRRAFAWLLD
ncbi:DUF4336 domain-containing protein [Lutimaribacter sp. EGI FJ00015]|uniref:DUF4336 domain-containing protein n=1 Tax=Lutimaribacter degradans TaxID=2945989 RepID=A0ACC5ZSA6_9RHOB|nr:DUF4336 domain-containing protein [Lutimaribacter sp. EGI FJ00013]MCM2561058.1 DUF4336 domain-containing protein [Lutimaribacter sp. EGI FJ00013]MCO0611994.1 DUF4336 domain-containing protein [Lutimaribacter sp. EGI FJ00015]MCO0634886.1 DUF4336 domain-containing protein [Lutimaribacter sp. EGI FJ00014]